MSFNKATVMGSGTVEGPASVLTPSLFTDRSDRPTWRESITDWCDNVLACASAGDSKAKGIAACLAITLYMSLPLGTKEQVKPSVRSGEIVLTPHKDPGAETKTEIVNKILDIVAKDTTVDRISRMVRLNKYLGP